MLHYIYVEQLFCQKNKFKVIKILYLEYDIEKLSNILNFNTISQLKY